MKNRVAIIDGHNFLFRGFYGVPVQVKRTDGTQINAVYGFFSLLRSVVKKIDPKYLVVVFDSETSANNKKLKNPEYKANRPTQENSIFDQLSLIKKSLDIMGINWIEDDNNEADDIIGTYSEKFNKKNIDVFICSHDHDFFQLVRDNVYIVRGSQGDLVMYDDSLVFQKYGVTPKQYVDYLALIGDISDNIKGIKGLGKKRATSILVNHKNIDEIYKSFNIITPSLQKMLLGKEDELVKRKEFLKINSGVKLRGAFNINKYEALKESLPEKMGEFLTKHWDKII